MKIVKTIAELDRIPGQSVGFVPTMGFFHEGHLALMRASKKRHDRTVVSIFVNPTQFGEGEDFERYPRDLDRDAGMAEAVGVDLIFAPSVEEMYPRRTTEVVVSGVTDRWEGAFRPGHYRGVATVVAKLFGIVRPDTAYFGLKDLQQCLVLRRMVQDLNLPVGLRFEQTVREPDGLALSSRNVYLSADHRALAPHLNQELRGIRDRVVENSDVRRAIDDARTRLTKQGFAIDYLEMVDLDAMAPIDHIESESALIVAAKLGKTRLIDNLIISSEQPDIHAAQH